MGRIQGRIILSGYAKLPSNTAAQKLYDQLVVVADVDFDTGLIMEAECTMATELGKRFVRTMLRGHNLNNGVEPLLEEIDLRYYGHLKRAMLSAIREIGQQYAELKKENQ